MTSKRGMPGLSIGPRVRKSPFYEATRRWGAKSFTVYNHMYLPTAYTSPIEEYWKLVNDVSLWDVACQRQIEISGPGAFELIQQLTPRDMSCCRPGFCWYLLLTDQYGGIVNDVVMLQLDEDKFWLSPGDGDALLWIKGVAVNSGLDVLVHEPDVSPLQLQGPKSPYVAKSLFGETVLDLPYYGLMPTKLGGIPLLVSRTGWSGELGYEIYLRDSRFGDELWEKIMAAGKAFGIAPIAPSTIRSIEGGLLSYVSDINQNDTPYTINITRLIDLNKPGGFIGQQALNKINQQGEKRKLVGLEIGGEALLAGNEEFRPVSVNGQEVGHLTRCCWSPRLEKNIGFANVPVDCSEHGTSLLVSMPESDRQAVVCNWPWFSPQKKIPANI